MKPLTLRVERKGEERETDLFEGSASSAAPRACYKDHPKDARCSSVRRVRAMGSATTHGTEIGFWAGSSLGILALGAPNPATSYTWPLTRSEPKLTRQANEDAL